MLSATQLQMTAVSVQETATGKAEVGSNRVTDNTTAAAAIEREVSLPSTTVTLSVTAQALAAITKTGLLKEGNPDAQFVSGALEGLQSPDPDNKNQRPRTKSKLEKMLQKTTLLELLDRWSMQREAEKKGSASNPEAIKLKLKNMEQMKDLL